MGLFDWIKNLLKPRDPFAELDRRQSVNLNRGVAPPPPPRSQSARKPSKGADGPPAPHSWAPARSRPTLGVDELARRLAMGESELRGFKPAYHTFTIPKRNGGTRTITAPNPETKHLQRLILRRVLGALKAHPAAHGFERGRSTVTNAVRHTQAFMVVKMDIRNYFQSTSAERIEEYFGAIGWDKPAAALLTRLTTHKGGLPQGAPTSPRLSNLVNWRLDMSLTGLAEKARATYTRYADDMTFSLQSDDRQALFCITDITRDVLYDFGYQVHWRKTLHLRRYHQRQTVTGIVVNDGLSVPREVRRRLRAIEHRLSRGEQATLTPTQLAGWRAYLAMVEAGNEIDPTDPDGSLEH